MSAPEQGLQALSLGGQPNGAPPIADPFDRADFNAASYVNDKFPDEESLADLGPFIDSLRSQIRRVDADILEAVRRQSASGSKARAELAATRSATSEMLSQVAEIRRKAAQSEAMVQEICRDIKKLDYAKNHLTATITALRRLGMLLSAVDQLQAAAEKREFGEAAHLLGAVQQLAAHFKEYSHVPRVAETRGRVAALEQALRGAALREFELLGEDPPGPALLDRLRDCAAVAAAAGPAARDELVDAVCRREMGVYTQIFSTIGETAKLERTMNRYKWLLRRLEARKEVWSVFPSEWRVPQLLCVTFCSITKTQLAEILDEKAGELPGQVQALLAAVEATHIFEAEMTRRYDDGASTNDITDGTDMYNDAQMDAAEVRAKYERARREGGPASPTREAKRQHAAAEAVARATFKGAISQVFTPYLHIYVENVGRGLSSSVASVIAAESWRPLAPDQPILRSANELTDAVRGEMRDCAARVSRGQTLLDLAAVFGRAYTSYAGALVDRLPKTAAGGHTGTAALGATDWQVKLEGDAVEVAALVVATAEHCVEMLRQLEKALAQRLDPPLGERVDFAPQEDEFRGAVTKALSVLVLGTETMMDAPLGALMRKNWAAVEAPDDQSEYVGTMRAALSDVARRAAATLPPLHFRFFLEKLLRSMAPRVREAVFRCRALSDAGCQQLRLDLEALKGALGAAARAGGAPDDEDAAAWAAAFSSDVAAQLAPVEAVLKVVASPPPALLDAFFELMPDAPPTEFQRVADLKGMKRSELTAVLEEYSRRVGHVLPPAAVGGGGGVAGAGPAATRPPPSAVAVAAELRRAGSGSAPGSSPLKPGVKGAGGATAGAGGVFRAPSASRVASKASASAQDMAAKLRQNANLQAARATDSMRETTGRMLGAMKNLRFMQRDQQQGQGQQ